MRYTTTITPRYQVHIPSAVRREIGLTKHGRAHVYAEGARIVIEPSRESIISLAGMFSVKHPISAEKIRKAISYVEKKK